MVAAVLGARSAAGMLPIVGTRYRRRGENYDLCQAEYDKLGTQERGEYDAIPPPRTLQFAHRTNAAIAAFERAGLVEELHALIKEDDDAKLTASAHTLLDEFFSLEGRERTDSTRLPSAPSLRTPYRDMARCVCV